MWTQIGPPSVATRADSRMPRVGRARIGQRQPDRFEQRRARDQREALLPRRQLAVLAVAPRDRGLVVRAHRERVGDDVGGRAARDAVERAALLDRDHVRRERAELADREIEPLVERRLGPPQVERDEPELHSRGMLACAAMNRLALVVIVACGKSSDPTPTPAAPVVPTPAPAKPVAYDDIGATFGKHLGAREFDAAVGMFTPELGGKLTAAKFSPDWDKSIEGAGKFVELIGTAVTPIDGGANVLVRYRFEHGVSEEVLGVDTAGRSAGCTARRSSCTSRTPTRPR